MKFEKENQENNESLLKEIEKLRAKNKALENTKQEE